MEGRYNRKKFAAIFAGKLAIPFIIAAIAHCALYWVFTEYKAPFFRVNDGTAFINLMDEMFAVGDKFDSEKISRAFLLYYPGYDFGHSGIEQTAIITDAETNEILASDDFTLPDNKLLKEYLENKESYISRMETNDTLGESNWSKDSTIFFYERYSANEIDINREKTIKTSFSEKKTLTGYETCHVSGKTKIGGRNVRVMTVMRVSFYSYFFKYLFPSDLILFTAAFAVALVMALQKNTANIQDEYRRNIINSLSHDLKTPLTIISGCAENLRENVNPEKREFYENAIIENAKYTESIINDALELSRSEKDYAVPQLSEFELKPVAEELWSKYQFSASEREITLIVSGNTTLKADRKMISQMMENLISNAVKYADDKSCIEVMCSSDSVTVSNSFSGKISTDINRLTEPFVRGTDERSGRNGSGVGLAIVKNIADAHRYKMSIELKNKRFTVYIKLKRI